MIASKPIRLLALAIVAPVVVTGVRAVAGGFALDGDLMGAPSGAGEHTEGVVAYVLDGDTVQVATDEGREVRVRLLGINAPEIPHPGKLGECYGAAATRHLQKLLPAGTEVTLVSDPTQDDVDDYGRLLRYVEVSGRDVGRAQISAGAASARDGAARRAKYQRAEAKARAGQAGMWRACQ